MDDKKTTNYRNSGFLLAGIAAGIFLFLLLRGTYLPAIAIGAAVLGILALVEAWPLRRVIDLLMVIGDAMHRITNPLIFGVIYLLAVIPTALVLKLMKKDVLNLRFDASASTYWQDRAPRSDWPESFRYRY